MNQIRYQAVTALGLDLFYREAGPQHRRPFCGCTAFRPHHTCSQHPRRGQPLNREEP